MNGFAKAAIFPEKWGEGHKRKGEAGKGEKLSLSVPGGIEALWMKVKELMPGNLGGLDGIYVIVKRMQT